MKKELLELARRKGVVIRSLTWTNKWVSPIGLCDNYKAKEVSK